MSIDITSIIPKNHIKGVLLIFIKTYLASLLLQIEDLLKIIKSIDTTANKNG